MVKSPIKNQRHYNTMPCQCFIQKFLVNQSFLKDNVGSISQKQTILENKNLASLITTSK